MSHFKLATTAAALLMGAALAGPALAAPINCPSYSVGATNYASNPSFEFVGSNGNPAAYPNGTSNLESAAKAWTMHSDNAGARVSSELVTTHAPGPNGANMLRFTAGGAEGGVIQYINNLPAKIMFSAWVFVVKGKVAIQADSYTPYASAGFSTKTGEWEQLRVCTDGTSPRAPDSVLIFNEDTNGGQFYVDRVEVRQIY